MPKLFPVILLFAQISFFLSSCGTLPNDPALSGTFLAPYDRLGACVFERVTAAQGIAHTTYSDLRATGRVLIRNFSQEVAIWEAAFIRVRDNETLLEVRARSTIWGRDYWGRELLPIVRACAA